MEELCRDAPHLTERLREWTRVLRMSDWMCRRADEVADETFGEAGVLTAEEKSGTAPWASTTCSRNLAAAAWGGSSRRSTAR